MYLYDHPSGDKEVGGGGGERGRSIDRSFDRTERERSGTERERIGLFSLNVPAAIQ